MVFWLGRLYYRITEIPRYHPSPLNLNSNNRNNSKTDLSEYLGDTLLLLRYLPLGPVHSSGKTNMLIDWKIVLFLLLAGLADNQGGEGGG